MAIPQSQAAQLTEPISTDEGLAELQEQRHRRRWMPGWFEILWSNRKCRIGLIMLALMILVGIFAPWIAPYDPKATDFDSNLDPSSKHLLGTTTRGEDIFSQLVVGARTSLVVGIFGGVLATAISLVIGLTAGYLQGIVDESLSFLINLALVVPTLPLIAIIAAYSPFSGVGMVILIVGITGWAYGARIKRAQIITLRERDYITAAVFAGDGLWRILFREIMPNMISLVVAGYMGAAVGAIGAEAGLSFLGLGDTESVSWGTMSYWATQGGALVTGQWAWLLAPGLCLSYLITSLAFINFGVDALSNPHLREV